ncbi:DNA methyltransferase [Streptomyces hygroscopicus]|uniref:DNA methyltransferase n=1 Tax=Streptomyces hygroscopicus TaxID=1912 RepID=UPI00367ECAB0
MDTIITSPPYYGVRDYGHERQLGAEPNVDGWVNGLRLVARDLARVLRPHGSLWLNLGDSYARRHAEGATPKSLLLRPCASGVGPSTATVLVLIADQFQGLCPRRL